MRTCIQFLRIHVSICMQWYMLVILELMQWIQADPWNQGPDSLRASMSSRPAQVLVSKTKRGEV